MFIQLQFIKLLNSWTAAAANASRENSGLALLAS